MKTKKTFFVLQCCAALAAVLLAGYGFYVDNLNYIVISAVCVVLVELIDLYRYHLKEKADLLNYKNRSEALAYAVKVHEGSKDDFVVGYGEDMYEALLNQGYIHEFLYTSGPEESFRWEITRLGLNVHNKKLS